MIYLRDLSTDELLLIVAYRRQDLAGKAAMSECLKLMANGQGPKTKRTIDAWIERCAGELRIVAGA